MYKFGEVKSSCITEGGREKKKRNRIKKECKRMKEGKIRMKKWETLGTSKKKMKQLID